MASQPFVKCISNLFSLLSVVVIAVSATLSFWFAVQYAASLEQHRGVVILMAYIALIAGYYGIALLSESVQNKADWILSKIFVGKVLEAPTQINADTKGSTGLEEKTAEPVTELFEERDLYTPGPLDVDIEILITRHDGASNPNLPSHLFPGSGSDGAGFTVQSMYIPTYSEIDRRLSYWDMDSCMVDYDEETGQGYFRMVDAEAPAKGTRVLLKPVS